MKRGRTSLLQMSADLAAVDDVDGEAVTGAFQHVPHPKAQGVQVGRAQGAAVSVEDRDKLQGFLLHSGKARKIR